MNFGASPELPIELVEEGAHSDPESHPTNGHAKLPSEVGWEEQARSAPTTTPEATDTPVEAQEGYSGKSAEKSSESEQLVTDSSPAMETSQETVAENTLEAAPAATIALPEHAAASGLTQILNIDTSTPQVSPALIVLNGAAATALTPYEGIIGKVLSHAWSRTSLFFTSTHTGEGSTEAAINLAVTLSRRAEPALLVDLRLTDSAMGSLLGMPEMRIGVEEALGERVAFEDCLYDIPGEKLHILAVKQTMTGEEAAHCSGALNDFLEWAEERYAWLVLDCPPVLSPAWTRWFELNADPIVLVAQRATTRKHALRTAVRKLGDRLAATVMSGGVLQPDALQSPLRQSDLLVGEAPGQRPEPSRVIALPVSPFHKNAR